MATTDVEHPRLLPQVLVPDPDGTLDACPRKRSTRDWVVDVALFVLALAVGFAFWASPARRELDQTLVVVDAIAGVAMCLALWLRRRWPLGVALLSVPAAAFSTAASAAVGVALFSLAVHRRWPAAVIVALLQVAVAPLYFRLHPDDQVPFGVLLALVAVVNLALVAWGMFVRSRRQLLLTLSERARRAESEQQLRVEQARQAERARIAREMHDVLAHRISLVSLHAGALEFRPGAPEEEVTRAAGVIRAAAHQALTDLREVIGVLREDPGLAAPERPLPERPQPTLSSLPALLDESRAAGMRVDAVVEVEPMQAVPETIGRSALRIVQEALTNARKHAPGARVDVRVTGAPGAGLTIDVTNPAPVRAAPASDIPGAGTGLVGLTERATLVGGRLEHGMTEAGEFRLHAWLPWPA